MNCIIRSWTDRLVQSLIERLPFHLTRHDIPIPHLPEAFQGFTIVQISDLHVDRWNRAIVEAALDAVNALQPDLFVCTGDIIAEGSEHLADVTHLLGQFRARHGKLACLGNHDYSDGHDSHGVRQALKKAGFEVLVNESTDLTLGSGRMHLAGADDLILGSQCLLRTTCRIDDGIPTLLLSHNPENFDAMAHFNPDLVLSGHTHGGQIQLPQGVHHRMLGSPYVSGLYQQKTSHLYVNQGLGSAVFVRHLGRYRLSLPTPRWAVPPEISVFRLVNPAFSGTTRLNDRCQVSAA